MWDRIMLRKRYMIECIDELLKNRANLVHSRHRSIYDFIMNLCSALTAYCFFDNKPEALSVHVEKSKRLELLHADLIPNTSRVWAVCRDVQERPMAAGGRAHRLHRQLCPIQHSAHVRFSQTFSWIVGKRKYLCREFIFLFAQAERIGENTYMTRRLLMLFLGSPNLYGLSITAGNRVTVDFCRCVYQDSTCTLPSTYR